MLLKDFIDFEWATVMVSFSEFPIKSLDDPIALGLYVIQWKQIQEQWKQNRINIFDTKKESRGRELRCHVGETDKIYGTRFRGYPASWNEKTIVHEIV